MKLDTQATFVMTFHWPSPPSHPLCIGIMYYVINEIVCSHYSCHDNHPTPCPHLVLELFIGLWNWTHRPLLTWTPPSHPLCIMYYVLFCPLTPFISWQRPHPASPPCIGIMYHIMKMDNEHIPLPPPMSTPIQFVLELCIMLWIVLWYHVIKLATEITFVLKASQRHHPCIGIRYYVMKLGTEILLYQIPSVSPPLRQHHHHPPCIMFWNTNIIPIHNMTTGKFLNRSLTENWPAVQCFFVVRKSRK